MSNHKVTDITLQISWHKFECKVMFSEAKLLNFEESSITHEKPKEKAWKKADRS